MTKQHYMTDTERAKLELLAQALGEAASYFEFAPWG